MRVVHHKQFSNKTPNKKLRHKVKSLLGDKVFRGVCLALVVGFIVSFASVRYLSVRSKNLKQQSSPSEELNNVDQPYISTSSSEPKKFSEFSGEAFKQLYESIALPNTKQIDEPLSITGNFAADERIRAIAENRGYRRQTIPERSLIEIDGFLLQEKPLYAWLELKTAAATSDISIDLVSAFRGPIEQRELFLAELARQGLGTESIINGSATSALNIVLDKVAVPGYSKHHTGYTIDIKCLSNETVTFGKSVCFAKLSENNYELPKQYGWIPSYPPGAGLQGPEPEPWEYVWVGKDALYEN